MVAYCFPSNSDSTFISLSKSSPVKTKKGISGDNTAMINDAKITYKVNGVERDVHLLSNGIYYVKGGNKAGDDIEMTASADNLNSVNASTVIPEAPIMDSVRYKRVRESDNDGNMVDYNQLQVTFKDVPNQHDYYAVKVLIKHMKGFGTGEWDDKGNQTVTWQVIDSTYTWAYIDIERESLISTISSTDEDYGFSDDFYQYFYIFDGATIDGRTYTLHLNISDQTIDGYDFTQYYKVYLYKLTPEYYKLVKSINDENNNDLAKYGLSQITPTFTNVNGGIGALAGYNVIESDWIKGTGTIEDNYK
jgi:hypothetical protein